MKLKTLYLQNPKQWTASGMAAAILILALLGFGIIRRGRDYDMPHAPHADYECNEPSTAVSIFASGTATVVTRKSKVTFDFTQTVRSSRLPGWHCQSSVNTQDSN